MYSGHVNVASPPPSSSPFAVPAWALYVNGLWFMSLIISLAASSLGMLVKSWLREYLASDWTSPQMQLRARQYRHPALVDWKVFEIAATLPLLIQLSLALFFVGLCAFTKSVDEHMFWTSVPLVGAWALFLFVTTFAPLVSPRCPYKLSFMHRLLTFMRNVLQGRLDFASTDSPPELPPPVLISPTKWLSKSERNPVPNSASRIEEEEQFAILSAQHDKSILMDIDETMLDDSELGAICNAYYSSQPDPEQVTTFILDLIHQRLGIPEDVSPTSPLTSILDLSRLSLAAYLALMKTASDMISHDTSLLLREDSPKWLGDAVIILLSNSPYPLPHYARDSLADVLSDAGQHSLGGRAIGRRLGSFINKHRPFMPLSLKLISLCHVQTRILIATPLHIYNQILGAHVEIENTLLQTLWAHPDLIDDPAVRPILDDIWDFVHRVLIWRLPQIAYFKGMMYCLIFMLQFAPRLGQEQERQATKILADFWGSEAQIFRLVMLCDAVNPQSRLPDAVTYPAMERTSLDASLEGELVSDAVRVFPAYARV